MEKDFKKLFREIVEPTHDINVAMFGFGVSKGNRKLLRASLELNNPIKDKLKDKWSLNELTEISLAEDSEVKKDILITKEGTEYPMYQIEVARKFNRPSWGYFYVMGMTVGEYLQEDFTIEELKQVQDEVLKCLSSDERDQLNSLVENFILR
jgi:hypothetical protein